jgi:hypothetical protein
MNCFGTDARRGSFEMVMPVIAKIGKATKVHGSTLCNFELAVITSLFDFGIKSPLADPLSSRFPATLAIFWFVLNPEVLVAKVVAGT